MPGLAVVYSSAEDAFDGGSVADGLVRSLRVPGVDYVEERWSDGRLDGAVLALHSAFNGRSLAVDESHQLVLLVEGEVYNLAALRTELPSDAIPADGVERATALLALYRAKGTDFVRALNGEFNIAVYDGRAQTLQVFCDRWAGRPLYYAEHGGRVALASEKKALMMSLGMGFQFDAQGVLELFAFGHNLDGRTVFRGVSAVPPGSAITVDESGIRIDRYWRPAYQALDGSLSLRDWGAELGRRLCEATALRARSRRNPAIFLSGGLDSRTVAGGLFRSGVHARAFTFGSEASNDVRCARGLARALGFEHRRLSYDSTSPIKALPRIVWRTEGSLPFHETASIELHRHIGRNTEAVFNGHFGDVLTGGHVLPWLIGARDLDALADRILLKRTMLRRSDLEGVFRPDFLDSGYAAMRNSVLAALSTLDDGMGLARTHNLWDMTVRQVRLTFNSPVVDRYLFEQVTPFVDNQVVDWALRMPLRGLISQRAYKRAIVDTFPEMAAIPWARTGRRIHRNLAIDIWSQAVAVFKKRLRRKLPTVQRAGGVSDSPWDLRQPELKTRLEEFMASEAFPDHAFDRDGLADTVEEHFNRRRNHKQVVACLLTLAETLRLFGDGCPSEPPPETIPDLEQDGGME